jgi:hypothetical protein
MIRRWQRHHTASTYDRTSVRKGYVDFGICVYEGEGLDLQFQGLFEGDLNAVYRPSHLLHAAKNFTLVDLTQYSLTLTSLQRAA